MFITNTFRQRLVRNAFVGCASALIGLAGATENNALRIAPGWAGGELPLPLMPGVNFTVGVMHYSSSSLKDNNGNAPVVDLGGGMTAEMGGKISATVTIPRLVWMSEKRLWGAYVGAVVLAPYVSQRQNLSLTGPAPIQPMLDAQAAALSGDGSGWGDLEIGPVLSWTDDKTNASLALPLILPTGSYDKSRAVNAGAGDYKTFRPTLSVGYAGDGWEAGARVSVAFNGRNKATGVKSGSYQTVDYSLLKELGAVRAGAQGYLLQQFTKDDGPNVAAHGNKGRAFAIGPAVSWTSEDSTWVVDAKVLKEFRVRNRSQGVSTWLSVTKQF